MLLEVHERFALLNILPKTGDYAALKTIRRAKEMISFTPEEIRFYGITNGVNPETGKPQVNWNTQKAQEVVKDVPVDEYVTNVIRDKLSELSKKGQLTEDFMSLYEKFVIIYQWPSSRRYP
jgi:hypothetical protein